MQSDLDELYQQTIQAITTNHLDVINDNTGLLKEYFNVMTKESDQPNDSKLINIVISYCDDLISTLINGDHLTIAHKMLLDLYDTSLKEEYQLYLEKTFRALLTRIKYTQNTQFLTIFSVEGLIIRLIDYAQSVKAMRSYII